MRQYWLILEADHPGQHEHVVCGPFDTVASAETHMDSLQVQSWVEDDCIDLYADTTDEVTRITALWDVCRESWGRYRPVSDDEMVDVPNPDGKPSGLALLPDGRQQH